MREETAEGEEEDREEGEIFTFSSSSSVKRQLDYPVSFYNKNAFPWTSDEIFEIPKW